MTGPTPPPPPGESDGFGPPPGEQRLPPQPGGSGAIIGGILTGLLAGLVSPILSVMMTGQFVDNVVVALLAIPAIVLGLGLYLIVSPSSRRFGAAFLSSFFVGSILLAGVCVSLLNSLEVG